MENSTEKYIVVSSFARFEGDDGGYLTTDSFVIGRFNSIKIAIEKVKEDIECTINDETNGYEDCHNDEEISKYRDEYNPSIDEDPNSIQKDLDKNGWSEIGTINYTDGYNYVAAKYTMYLNK